MKIKFDFFQILAYLFLIIRLTFCAELKFVFELFRHGARAPWGQLNITQDKLNQTWSGDSELTLSGMRQHYLLGHQIRNKYIKDKKFIDENYNQSQLYVISTDTNRTIMSAYSQLLGIYPPSTGPNLTQNQLENAVPPVNVSNLDKIRDDLGLAALPNNTQIFPIHVFSKIDRYINLQDPDVCIGVKGTRDKMIKKQNLTNALNKFNSDYPKLSVETGLNFSTWNQLFEFSDAFASGYFDQKQYPNISYNLEELNNRLLECLKLEMFEALFGDDDQFIAINAMTPIINRLQSYFNKINDEDNKEINENTDPKMVLYSAHDTNIAAMLIYLNTAFGLKMNYSYVKFAANIFLEFSRKDNTSKPYSKNDYTIEIFYNSDKIYSDSYLNFKKFSDKISINSIETADFCGWNNQNDNNFIIAIGCLSLIAVGLIVAIIFTFIRRKRSSDYLAV